MPRLAARLVVGRRRRGRLGGTRRDVDRLLRRNLPGLGWLVLVGEPLLEAFQALGDVAHHRRKTITAEQQQDENRQNQDMPNAETAHEGTPIRETLEPT